MAAQIVGQNEGVIGPVVGPGIALDISLKSIGVTSAQYIHVAKNRPVWTTGIYFQSEDCTGARFIPFDPDVDLYPTAQFDGQTFWGGIVNQAGIYKMKSKFTSVGDQGWECQEVPKGQRQLEVAPTFPFNPNVTPPFRIVP